MEALASLPVAEGEAGAIRLRDVAEVRTEERLVECSSSRCGAGSLAGCIRLRPPEPRGKPVRSIQADVARRLAELELPAGVSVSVDPPEGAGATDRVVLVVSGPDRSECRAAATALAMRLAATREVIAVVGPAPLEPTSVAAIDPDAVPQDGLDPAFLVAVPALVEGASVGAVALDGQRPRPLRLFADNDASGAAAATGRLERLGGLLPEGVTLPIRIVPTERPRRLLRLDGRPAETIGLRLAVRTTEVPSAVIDAAAGVPIPPDAILGWRLGESPP
jgi:multidrug efflux pump subunit AcrB